MSGFDKEMQDALRADAEKLRAMGVDVADPIFLETDPQEMTARARQYAEQLDAHMDEGGTYSPANVRDLISFILDLTNCDAKASGWREEAYSAAFDVLWRAITEYRWQDLPEGAVTEHLRESSKRALDAAAIYLLPDEQAASPKASGWRDIESDPPRDEQECLFLQGRFCFQGYWVTDAKHIVACGAPYGESVMIATHWQPLPPPLGQEDNTNTGEQE